MDTRVFKAINKLKEEYWWRNSITFGGFDVGKRGNPSHSSIFAIAKDSQLMDNEGNPVEVIVMIHQKFLDNWEYTRQVDYLTDAVKYFNIQKLYYDNTRGELEERSLPRQCIPVVLSNRTGAKAKGKAELATNFSKLVEQKRIRLIDEDRFLSQILCVTGDLQAPNTPRGHGDSFISVMLAAGVYFDFFASDRQTGTSCIGNLQDIIDLSEGKLSNIMEMNKNKNDSKCKICGGINFDLMSDGRKICQKCFTIW